MQQNIVYNVLQKVTSWIHQLFNYGQKKCKETEIVFSGKNDVSVADAKKITERFDNAVTIKGTMQYHAFIPTEDRRFQLKKYSSSAESDYFPKNNKRKKSTKK